MPEDEIDMAEIRKFTLKPNEDMEDPVFWHPSKQITPRFIHLHMFINGVCECGERDD